MFRDAKEELKRLEAALMAQERLDRQAEEAEQAEETPEQTVYQNFSNHYGKDLRNYASGYKAYNADRSDMDPEEYEDEIYGETKRSNFGLKLLACALVLCIALVLLYWVLRLWGI